MKQVLVGAAVALTIWVPSSWAAGDSTPHYSPTFEKCSDRSNGVTSTFHACYADEVQRQDMALNETYKKLISLLKPDRKAGLQRTERTWIAFRDAECDYQGSKDAGGSDVPLIIDDCVLEQTTMRLKTLRDDLSFEKDYGDN